MASSEETPLWFPGLHCAWLSHGATGAPCGECSYCLANAEIKRLRRAGNTLADHMAGLLADTHEKRYTDDGGCRGCYDALEAWRSTQPNP